MKKDILYLIIIGLLIYFVVSDCINPSPDINNGKDDVKTEVRIDTIKIPADTSTVKDIPKPKIVYKDNPELLKALDSIKNHNEQLEFLLSKLTIKEYDTLYDFERGSVKLFEKVQGEILERNLEMVVKEFEYEQTITTHTITKYPKFALSVGFSLGIDDEKEYLYNPSLGNYIEQNTTKPYAKVDFGYRNRQGYEYGFRTNFKNNFEIALKKDIFVKY